MGLFYSYAQGEIAGFPHNYLSDTCRVILDRELSGWRDRRERTGVAGASGVNRPVLVTRAVRTGRRELVARAERRKLSGADCVNGTEVHARQLWPR